MRTPTRQERRELRAFRYAVQGYGTRSAIEAVMGAALRLDDVRVIEVSTGAVIVLAVASFWRRLVWMFWPWGMSKRFRRAAKLTMPAGIRARLLIVGRRRFERLTDA